MREYLQKEWLPAIRATIRPTTYRSYVQHVDCHIVPHIGTVKLEKLSGATINALYAKLAQSGKAQRQEAASRRSPSATCTPSCTGHSRTPSGGAGSRATPSRPPTHRESMALATR